MAVIAFILIFLIPIANSSPDNWIIDNSTNSVYVDDAKAYISVSPHTLKESGDIIINLKSKVYTGNIDVVFGFNTTTVKPTNAFIYNFGTQQYQDVSSSFDKVTHNFGGMNIWYFRKNIPVVAGQDYRLKVSVQVPYISKGKYWIAIKPSTETIAQAITNGHLYYLDPWWDASWMYKIDNAIANGARPYQLSLNVSNATGTNNATHVFCGGKCNVNFTDIRFALDDTTSLPYWIENNSTGQVWINVTANGSVSMYYSNPSATSASNGTNTFNLFDNFEGAGLLSWTDNAGTWVNEDGYRKQTSTTLNTFKSSYVSVALNDYVVHAKMKVPVAWGQYGREGLTTEKDVTTGNYWHVGCLMYDDKTQVAILLNDLSWNGVAPLGFAAQLNTWYSIDMLRQVDIQKLSVQPIGTSLSWQSQTVLTSRSNKIAGLHGGSNNAVWFDDFYVRRYISPELTWSTWGDEQNVIISSWGNNYSNDDDLVFTISENENINFNITKRYAADTINWYVNSVNQSNNLNNLSVTINSIGMKNITATVTNATFGTGSISWFVTLNMQLITPVNGSIIYSPFPPAAPEVSFLWTSTGYPFYNLVIGTDANFNTVTSSTYYSSEQANVFLLSGKQYFWKVRSYTNPTTPGAWSGISNFYLTANYSLPVNVTGIYGVVYEKKSDGSLLPIHDAVVMIGNTSWSDLLISGTNGYYEFSGLKAVDVYTIRATANGYEAGSTEYVNATNNTWTQKNLFLQVCRSGFTCFYDQHFVQFTVQNIWFTKYAGVAATVYKGQELTASDTQTTGTDGSVNFLLIKDQQYRITFINATAGISVTWTGYPSKTDYYIITDATTSSWDTHGTDAATTTQISVTTQTINDTHAYVNMSYNDTLAGTSNLMFYLNKSIAGDPNNQTNLQSINGGSADQYNASFIVSGYGGNSYIVRVKADHSTYGTISYSYAVQFAQLPGPLSNFNPTIILMLFVAFILFLSGVFGQTTNTMSAGILCGIVWILSGIGVFSAVNAGAGFYLALTLATIIVIIMNINERGRQEALQ